MADDKKYYYMRLKEDFFDSDNMILLESMPDGYLYSNILLKLYLRSLKEDGRLMLNGRIPYNPQMLAAVTRHQIGTVEKAVRIFRELGLIEILDNGAIYMLDIQNFIGKSGTEADRKREYRVRIAREKQARRLADKSGDTVEDKCPDKSTPEIESEIEKEIEIDIEKEIDKEKENPGDKSPEKRKRFSPPTLEEVKAYCLERKNRVDAERFIDYYTSNGWQVGKNKMRDWKAAVRTWERSSFPRDRETRRPETIWCKPPEDEDSLDDLF